MDLDKIEKLQDLKNRGILTEDEFQRAKQRALGEISLADAAGSLDSKSYSMLMHLSQLCSFVIPFAGLAIPIVMWVLKKEDPYVDAQGKVVANWVISSIIYMAGCLILTLVVIGVFLLLALVICSIIFIVMGAVRASDGIVKDYPLAIRFFKVSAAPTEMPE